MARPLLLDIDTGYARPRYCARDMCAYMDSATPFGLRLLLVDGG